MKLPDRFTQAAVLPYVVWMALLFSLPATAGTYALRTALTAFLLVASLWGAGGVFRPWSFVRTSASWFWGLLIGLVVCFLWIFPEQFAWYRETSLLGLVGLAGPVGADPGPSPYEPAVCGWTLTWVKLFGSAFIIAPVEELFFRSFLYRWLQRSDWTAVDPRRFDWSAFLWMVGLFALEHHTRLAAGAMAGAFYGWLAIRKGLGSAILAHMTTNLVLGLYVIYRQQWLFW